LNLGGSSTGREYPEAPIPGVAAVVFHEGKVLLTRRENEPSKGMWGIPGGVVEVGETVEEAVVREVLEETGVRVRPVKLITSYDSIVKDDGGRPRYHYVLIEYLCEYLEGEPKAASDALDARWFPLDELGGIDMRDGTRRFLEKMARREGLL